MAKINSDNELNAAVFEISTKLQDVQNYVERKHSPNYAKIRFPRGYIRTANEIVQQLPKDIRPVAQRNIAYTLMMSDVLRWLIIRTDLDGVIRSMIIKQALVAFASVCEVLTKEVLRGIAKARDGYKVRTNILVKSQVISDDLRIELDWLWDIRQNQHLHLVNDLELETYSRNDYNRALAAVKGIQKSMIERHD